MQNLWSSVKIRHAYIFSFWLPQSFTFFVPIKQEPRILEYWEGETHRGRAGRGRRAPSPDSTALQMISSTIISEAFSWNSRLQTHVVSICRSPISKSCTLDKVMETSRYPNLDSSSWLSCLHYLDGPARTAAVRSITFVSWPLSA